MHLILQIIKKKFTIVGGVKVAVFYFKQLPLNIIQKFEFSYHSIKGESLLSVVVGIVRLSDFQLFQYHQVFQSIIKRLQY